MKFLHASLLFALGAALLAPVSADVSSDAPAPASGLLGKRYAEASAFLIDYHNFEDAGYGVGTAVNVPLAANIDAGAFFQHNWTESSASDHFEDLGAYVAAYTACGDFRPFAKATLAYEWWPISDDPWYQLDVGSEYLLTERLSVSAQASWIEFLAADWNGGNFAASGRANYWLTQRIATSVNVIYTEGGSWGYGVAAVFQF